MAEFLNNIIPNVMDKQNVFGEAIWQTVVMAAWSGIFMMIFGIVIGVIVTVTKPGGILPQPVIFQILDKIINFFRSIPFIILLAGLMPLSRMIMGTAIGLEGAIVPLIIAATPLYARQVESALSEVDPGLVEASLSMGCSPIGIIFRVYLKESIAAIARGTTIAIISLFGLIAMAGAVGAGGLGDFAIRYGHDRNQGDVVYVTIIVLVVIISVIQQIGNIVAKKNTH